MPTFDARPDPDALLGKIKAEEARQRRARLKIFFGFAPGVGKTFAMLESAQRLKAQGLDVLVGCVETHGRSETAALLRGLDVLPRRRVQYRGTELEELDLDAILARKPAIALVDELAHTNAPGSRHRRRFQDVLDLLEAGIDVHTTLNVQHVESLNDVVGQITGVHVRETVPDAIVERADDLEVCDLTPDELLIRLKEGKVYVPEAASRALAHFFQRGNLLALRELTFRRAADRADAEMRAYRAQHEIQETWPAGERLLVCISPSPSASLLVRAAKRLADQLHGEWSAIHVESALSAPPSPAEEERLSACLRLVEELGGESTQLSGPRVSAAILEHARRMNATRILLGKPTHARLRDRLRGSLLDEIVRGSGAIDVQVISAQGEAQKVSRAKSERPPFDWQGLIWAACLVGGATGSAVGFRSLAAPEDLVMIYLLVIMLVATRFGPGPSVLASALSVFAYDFFFVPPYLTFDFSDRRHILTFTTMFGVGIVISVLTQRIRRQEQSARHREARTATLYSLSRELGAAVDQREAAEVIARHAAEVFGAGAAVLLPDAQGNLAPVSQVGTLPLDTAELAVAQWVKEHARPAGTGTDTLPGAHIACVPLASGNDVLGVLAFAPRSAREARRLLEHEFLTAFVRQGALALARAGLAASTRAANLHARTEEMRSSLLSTVSRDLRAPLAKIAAAASEMQGRKREWSEVRWRDLAATIASETARLNQLLGNVLEMTHVDEAQVQTKRQRIAVEDVIHAALGRLEPVLEDRPISITLASDLPSVLADPVLLEQVFVSLLENAVKHGPKLEPIEISAKLEGGAVEIIVADRGPGLPPGDERRVLEGPERLGEEAPLRQGPSLSVCRRILEAHGGSLVSRNRPDGGAMFEVVLPRP